MNPALPFEMESFEYEGFLPQQKSRSLPTRAKPGRRPPPGRPGAAAAARKAAAQRLAARRKVLGGQKKIPGARRRPPFAKVPRWPQRPGVGVPVGGYSYPVPVAATAAPSEFVQSMQERLREILGWAVPVNGVMGPATRQAVRMFQKQQGLPEIGVFDQATSDAILWRRRRATFHGRTAGRGTAIGCPGLSRRR